MNKWRKVIYCIILVSVVIVGIIATALVVVPYWNSTHQTRYRTIYSSHVLEGQQGFMIGPDLCNLTWTLKMNNTAQMFTEPKYGEWLYHHSYTSLYYVNVSLVIREVGHTTGNVTQTIFIEPKVEPLGSLVAKGTHFELFWTGNITTYHRDYGSSSLGDWYFDTWAIPTLTFNMPYYVLNTTIAGTYSHIIARTFEMP